MVLLNNTLKGAKKVFVVTNQSQAKLIGREVEEKRIENHFENTLQNGGGFCFVTGEAGVGKTFLLQTVSDRLCGNNAKYIYVKFDQNDSSMIHVIGSIIRQLTQIVLTQDHRLFSRVTQSLEKDKRVHLSVLTSLCPELEKIFGNHTKYKIEDYKKHITVFHTTFYTFLEILSDVISFLCIQIDDYQWADDASINMFKDIESSIKNMKISWFFSQRNKLNMEKTFSGFSKSISKQIPCLEMDLNRLAFDDVKSIIKYYLQTIIIDEHVVVEKFFKATFGNPYYLKCLIDRVFENKDSYYDYTSQTWTFDDSILAKDILPDNMIDVIVSQVLLSSRCEKILLETLACLGGPVNIQVIRLVVEFNEQELLSTLSEITKMGALIEKKPILKSDKLTYSFSHDIIQEAVISNMSPNEKEDIHYHIAQCLTRVCESVMDDRLVFVTANQILACLSKIKADYHLERFINVLYKAGVKSKDTTMFKNALIFFESCLDLLDTNKHVMKQPMRLNVTIEFAECLFILGEEKRSIKILSDLVDQSQDQPTLVNIKKRMIMLYSSTASSDEIMKHCKEVLAILSFDMTFSSVKVDTLWQLFRFLRSFNSESVGSISGEATSSTYESEEIGLTLIRMIAIANLTDEDLFVLLVLKLCNYSIKNGTTESSLPAYAAGAYMLNSFIGNHTLALDLASKTEILIEKCRNKKIQCMTYFILGNFVKHWYEPVDKAVAYLNYAIKHGLDAEDTQYAGYSYTSKLEMLYASGRSLEEIEGVIKSLNQYDSRIKNEIVNITISLLVDHINKLNGDVDDDAENVDLSACDPVQVLTYNYYAVHRYYLMDDQDKRIQVVKEIEPMMGMFKGYYLESDLKFLVCVTWLDQHRNLSSFDQVKNRLKIIKLIRNFKHWADQSKENQLSRYHILQAKYNELFNGKTTNDELYDEAIRTAINCKQYFVAIVANLSASRYYHLNEKVSNMYRRDALECVQLWGGIKIAEVFKEKRHIKDNFIGPQLFSKKNSGACHDNLSSLKSDNEVTLVKYLPMSKLETYKIFESLDEEASLIYLLNKVLEGCIDAYGAVLIVQENEILITHEYVNGIAKKRSSALEISQTSNLSKNVLRYVVHTNSEVHIQDRRGIGFFRYDPYLFERSEVSVLCVPLSASGVICGYLYLQSLKNHGINESVIEQIKYYSSVLAVRTLSKQSKINQNLEGEIPLTKRELEVYKLIIKGFTNKEVSDQLNISISTVKTHLINIYSKLEIRNRVEAVEKAKEYGIS